MDINEHKARSDSIIPFFNTKKQPSTRTSRSSLKSNRLPFLDCIPDNARNHFVAMSAEFAGTTLFLFFAFSGTQVALLSDAPSLANVVGSVSNPAQLLYISLSFGFSLAVNAWAFFRISGGLFNPAVTMGMCLVGGLAYIRGLLLILSQILGGITAAAICSALFPGPLRVRTSLSGGTSVVQGLFIEMFLTAELVFTIFMLAAEKHKATFIAPIGIGLSLFIAELTGVYFTGGSVNPARSFGPSIISHEFHSYHWIYWVGPILGSLIASGFYKFIKMLEYETVNPNQDATKPDGEHFNPDSTNAEKSHVKFVPEDYAERGMMGSSINEQRPRSVSFSKAASKGNFSALENGGMHSDELIKPSYQGENTTPHSRESNASTLANGCGSVYANGSPKSTTSGLNPAMEGSNAVSYSSPAVNANRETFEAAPVTCTDMSSTLMKKTAMKPGTNVVDGRPTSNSMSNNTRNNRVSGFKQEYDDYEFYDKKD